MLHAFNLRKFKYMNWTESEFKYCGWFQGLIHSLGIEDTLVWAWCSSMPCSAILALKSVRFVIYAWFSLYVPTSEHNVW